MSASKCLDGEYVEGPCCIYNCIVDDNDIWYEKNAVSIRWSLRHCMLYSRDVRSSSSVLFLLLSAGSSRTSIPGPAECAFCLLDGKICHIIVRSMVLQADYYRTFVLLHPNLNAASCAKSSPNPSINPFTNGKSRLIAAPRSKLQIVGCE